MLQIFSLCEAEVGVSLQSLPGVGQFCLSVLILDVLRMDNLHMLSVSLLLPSGLSRALVATAGAKQSNRKHYTLTPDLRSGRALCQP